MNNNKKIIALLLVLVLSVSLAACGSKGGSSPSPVGTFKLVNMTQDGQETSKEDMDMLDSLGLNIILELREDNTGTLDMMGTSMELTWDDSTITVEGEATPYTFDGTTLSWGEEDGGTVMIFEVQKSE